MAMRVQNGNYAYELRKVCEPQTQAPIGWEYTVYRVQPEKELLHTRCCSPTREIAEREAQQIVTLYNEYDLMTRPEAA
jgi:hypothetical protein